MIPKPHSHNCAEFLYFIGGNPMDFADFGAEIEFVMGEGDDAETHTITSTTWIYIPKDLPHAPLDFKRVDRPIMFGHIMFAPGFVDHQLQPRQKLTGPASACTPICLMPGGRRIASDYRSAMSPTFLAASSSTSRISFLLAGSPAVVRTALIISSRVSFTSLTALQPSPCPPGPNCAIQRS